MKALLTKFKVAIVGLFKQFFTTLFLLDGCSFDNAHLPGGNSDGIIVKLNTLCLKTMEDKADILAYLEHSKKPFKQFYADYIDKKVLPRDYYVWKYHHANPIANKPIIT